MWGICGTCGGDEGYAGICGTDHLPEIDPAGLPFLDPPPPSPISHKAGTANDQLTEKRMLIFRLNC